jgi:hypothetical protein
LTTTGPPSSSAICRASCGVVASLPSLTGIPTRRNSYMPWYSIKSTAAMLTARPLRADQFPVGRGVIGMCVLLGGIVGGYVPVLWGASSLGAQSLLFGALGSIVGVFVGARIGES